MSKAKRKPSPSTNGNTALNDALARRAANISPAPGNNLDKCLRKHARGDDIQIGSDLYERSDEDETASWADVRKLVQGIRWSVRGYLPFGMLVGVIGQPKDGKSALALGGVVRPIITGCNWFTGQRGPKPGYVIWCDTERRAAVNLERAEKWRLPVDRIKTPFFDDPLRIIDLNAKEDIDRIFAVVCRYKAKLVVVDSFRGSHKGNENDSKIAESLQNLGAIGEATGASVLLIHHTRKIGIDEELTANSGRGSNAFLAMVACQWAIDRPDPKGDWRRLQVLGENLGSAPRPVGFRISDAGLEFGEAPDKPCKHTEKDAAADWLRERMKPGKNYKASDLLDEAEQHGHSVRTVRKAAAERLGIVPKPLRKDGKIAAWEWKLIDTEGNQRS